MIAHYITMYLPTNPQIPKPLPTNMYLFALVTYRYYYNYTNQTVRINTSNIAIKILSTIFVFFAPLHETEYLPCMCILGILYLEV